MNRICGRCNVNEAVNRKGQARCAKCKKEATAIRTKRRYEQYKDAKAANPVRRTCKTCGVEFETLHKWTCPACTHKKFMVNRPMYECPRCSGPMQLPKSKLCRSCSSAQNLVTGSTARSYPEKKQYLINAAGYTLELCPDHPRASKHGYVLEHILVMEEKIGRQLTKGENVHHKNGVRTDNRPENLELWVKTQPSGQRAEDLVEWAKEILERYGAM